jgi:hypothetical protein
MGPVDPDVVDLVVAVAQPDDTIDDAAWIGCKGGLRCLARGGAADDRAGALLVVGRDLADRLRGAGRSARKGNDRRGRVRGAGRLLDAPASARP